jgi:hypothetical protein
VNVEGGVSMAEAAEDFVPIGFAPSLVKVRSLPFIPCGMYLFSAVYVR